MSNNFMDEINKHATLALNNEMDMLTFYLSDDQQYGINVFKIIEVIETPKAITRLPETHPAMIGTISFRGQMVSIIDLSRALGLKPVDYENSITYIIVCEFNGRLQGFLISRPNKLLNKGWDQIKTPGGHFYDSAYLTAITYDGTENPVQILDVEKVLAEIVGVDNQLSEGLKKEAEGFNLAAHRVLAVDDSRAARTLLAETLDQIGVPYDVYESAVKGWEVLEAAVQKGSVPYTLIISDIEMPGMDGFTFTRKIKANPTLAGIRTVLFSSLSNQSNIERADLVGADAFIAKFQADKVARTILDHLGQAATNKT